MKQYAFSKLCDTDSEMFILTTHQRLHSMDSTSSPSSSRTPSITLAASTPRTSSSLSGILLPMSSSSSLSSSSSYIRLWSLLYLLLLTLVVAESGISDTIEDAGSDLRTVDDFLSKFGYYGHKKHHQQPTENPFTVDLDMDKSVNDDHVVTNPGLDNTQHTDTERHHAIERVQSFYHLPITGELDMDTKRIMTSARCGVRDVDDEGENSEEENMEDDESNPREDDQRKTRRKRYSIRHNHDGTVARWEVDKLTWRITRPTRQLSESVQRSVLSQAFAKWAKYVPIRFVEVGGNEEPDINIMFARGEHGPNDVFDGSPKDRQNVLAHAWHPGLYPKTIAGDVHFDDDDDWTNTNFLLVVAVHELGHTMGLDHSKDVTSVMYAAYQDTPEFSQDDLDGINALYGDFDGGRRPPTTTRNPRTRYPPYYTVSPEWRPVPTTAPDQCKTIRVDAMFEDPTVVLGKVYVAITGDHVHKLSSQGRLIQSQPLETAYPEVPANPDVAFSIPDKQTVYFIKDNRMWAYRGNQLEEGFPKSLHAQRFPEPPKFAVTLPDKSGSHRLLLFGANYWWTFDVDRPTTVRAEEMSSFSADLPHDVTFAATWVDNQLYAVSKDSYVIIDLQRRQITHDKPIAGKPEWLHALCDDSSKASATVSITALVILASLATTIKSFLL